MLVLKSVRLSFNQICFNIKEFLSRHSLHRWKSGLLWSYFCPVLMKLMLQERFDDYRPGPWKTLVNLSEMLVYKHNFRNDMKFDKLPPNVYYNTGLLLYLCWWISLQHVTKLLTCKWQHCNLVTGLFFLMTFRNNPVYKQHSLLLCDSPVYHFTGHRWNWNEMNFGNSV